MSVHPGVPVYAPHLCALEPRAHSSQGTSTSAQVDYDRSRYELVKELGAGSFGVAWLMKDRRTGELVACKLIERGDRIDKNVERELVNHRWLRHPNIVRFHEVFLTATHLGIVMEYAAGGELFERIIEAGRLPEAEARFFFQQLISGIAYCHKEGVCHRDLKLDNTLLDGSTPPRLKICDFGFSKSEWFDSQPKSMVGTRNYFAPEVMIRKQYDGKRADMWSCGVLLYVMIVGSYPFEDPKDPGNFRRFVQRTIRAAYTFPPEVLVSAECRDLISRIFQADPNKRATVEDIRRHPWFLRDLPPELADGGRAARAALPPVSQSVEELKSIVASARYAPVPPPPPQQHLSAAERYEDAGEAGDDDFMQAELDKLDQMGLTDHGRVD
ncbi:hypothetical protein WJX81_006569 [Elliptochloris bilobata]|uniref:Protein kinase domain-containing protein n=1 Tax=Elliptochloris bilobata TaxID=381761 RepID=A0AAW1RHK3_9CHLO